MNPYVWLNKRIVLRKGRDFPFYEEGFLYGQGLFETMRSYGGRVLLLYRHIRRLIDSCIVLDMSAPDEKLLITAVLETVKKNKLDSGYIRLNVWKRGKGAGIFVFTKKQSFYLEKDYRRGLSAVIIKDIRQSESSPMARVKSLNHYFYILMGRRANQCGAHEAIILNNRGEVCEGSRSNIFIVKDERVVTPPIRSGCLPGITRQAVLEVARKLKIDIEEAVVKPEDLSISDEVFLTNSLIEIMPLVKVDGRSIGSGKPGEKTKTILEEYRQLIKKSKI